MKKAIAGTLTFGALAFGGTAVADSQVNPYEDRGSHYALPVVADIKQNDHLEIAKDHPAIVLSRWNDEERITIEPQLEAQGQAAAHRPLLSKEIRFTKGAVTAFVKPAATSSDFDIDFALAAKPPSNVFTYSVMGAEDAIFYYQTALTEAEVAGGASRPENVVGSYAVYSKSRKDHREGATNYTTGKLFHIYRPKAIDATGKEVWATLGYSDGVLSVTVPQDYLDTATYPVTVDPTFGYTTQGASTGPCTADQLNSVKATLTESATLSKITFFGCNSPTKIKGVLYSDSGTHPNTNEAVGAAVTTNSAWSDSSITASLTASTQWVGFVPDSNNGNYSFDTGDATQRYFQLTAGYYTTPPATFPAGTVSNRLISVYATYTASGGGGTVSPANPANTVLFE